LSAGREAAAACVEDAAAGADAVDGACFWQAANVSVARTIVQAMSDFIRDSV
jgi:hypothetical protein